MRVYFLLISVVVCIVFFICYQANKKNRITSRIIREFENRKKYTVLTEDVLKQIPDEELVLAVHDYITETILENNFEDEYKIIKKQSKGIQYIWCVWWLEAEVNNGGFNQYFYNSSGQFAEEAYEACEGIGAHKTASIVQEAIKILFNEMDLYRKTKEAGTLEAFMESYNETELGRCDEEFYKYQDNLNGLIVTYIRSHYQEFVTKEE